MNAVTFRILDCLTSNLGKNISINELTSLIKASFGSAYYKNIYDEIQELSKKNFLILRGAGKSSLIELNFLNFQLIDLLSEMELKKKSDFFESKPAFKEFFFDLQLYFSKEFYFLKSISLINPLKSSKLNRFEFLFLLREPNNSIEKSLKSIQSEFQAIYSLMNLLEKKNNLKLDFLILRENEFFELLSLTDLNPLNELISNKIAFFLPEWFWIQINFALQKGIQFKPKKEFNPLKAKEKDLIFNLQRFGYKELGNNFLEGEKICFEFIIIAILLEGNQRRIEAIPMLLLKQIDSNKVNYNLLIFLCKKYNKLELLSGLLNAFNKLNPLTETKNALTLIQQLEVNQAKINLTSIKQKMRLYYGNK